MKSMSQELGIASGVDYPLTVDVKRKAEDREKKAAKIVDATYETRQDYNTWKECWRNSKVSKKVLFSTLFPGNFTFPMLSDKLHISTIHRTIFYEVILCPRRLMAGGMCYSVNPLLDFFHYFREQSLM